ncbi:MAG: ABC transporter substrate-binding protein [Deltaproteobacteria bacterium]|nr:ABC transporter substrate-binding protein [Deltaproteobacteria bacterium]
MKKLLLYAVAAGFLVWIGWSQVVSYEQMGERRFQALSRPAKEVLIGVCWPFSVNQDGMADGLQLALDEINTKRLAGGYAVRLVMRDDRLSAQKSERIAMAFADTPAMSAVIGYYDDAPAVKASAIFETSRLLHLITGANNTAMTSHGFQYVVRTIHSSEKIAQSLSRMTMDRGYRRIAVLWEEDAFGEDLAYQYRVGLDNLNAELVYQWSYNRARADYRLPVNELKGINADLIFFAGLEPWAGDFLRVARGVGLKTPIIGAFSNTPEMHRRAGSALEGAMYFDLYNPNSASPENQSFVQKFRARYGKDPDTWAAQGYDALHILAKAVQFTGSRNPADLAYAIRYMDAWEGANGRYKFNGAGELEDKPVYLNVFKGGMPVMIQESNPISKSVF